MKCCVCGRKIGPNETKISFKGNSKDYPRRLHACRRCEAKKLESPRQEETEK